MTASLHKLINKDDLEEFVHSSINFMIGIPSVGDLSQLDWSEEEIELTRKSLNSILYANVMIEDNLELQKSLKSHLHNLEESQQKCIFECFTIRRTEIMKHMVTNLNSHTVPLLNDFNWRLKWVLGSSSLAAHKEPFLQWDLILKKHTDDAYKLTVAELNIKELDTVISCLESIGSALNNTPES